MPAGMITDRDVAVGVVALDLDAGRTPVEAAMRADLACIEEGESVERALDFMRAQAVRRLPVVDRSGTLVGLLAADDVLGLLGEEVSTLAAVVERGMRREGAERRAEARQVP